MKSGYSTYRQILHPNGGKDLHFANHSAMTTSCQLNQDIHQKSIDTTDHSLFGLTLFLPEKIPGIQG
jgi:hypothetical protein